MRKLTNKEILERFSKIHGSRYDYEKVVYIKMKEKVEIICKTHGSFWQTPNHHIFSENGCPTCNQGTGVRQEKELAGKRFITNARKKHEKKYDYSAFVYKGNKEKVEIICKVHGSFWQTPSNHLHGFGCWECGREIVVSSRKLSGKEFFLRCEERHDKYYSYPHQEYKTPDTIITVSCPQHGDFKIKSRNHLWIGQGCRKCYQETRGVRRSVKWDEFYKNAIEIHEGKYVYDENSYVMLTEHVRIKCKKHGWFEQRGHEHLSGKGCSVCARELSRGRWQSSKIPDELKDLASSLYYFKLSFEKEVFYKIGISNDVNRRSRTIKNTSIYNVEIIDVLNGTLYTCMEMEESLHREYDEFSYTPDDHFGGYTECFSQDVLDLDSKS